MWRMTTLLHLTALLVLIPLCHCVSMHRHDNYMDMDQTYPNGLGYCEPSSESSCKAGFSYNRDICQGPYHWHTISSCYKACGQKRRQSPINIWSHRAVFLSDLPRLKFKPHMKSLDTKVTNHQNRAPEFEPEDGDKLHVKLKNLVDGHYKFHNLHIHNGKSRRKGSEHSVNRHFTPMEAQLVFHHDEKKENKPPRVKFGGVFAGRNQFVVVGVFLEVGDEGYGDEPDDDECKRILKGHFEHCDNNGNNGNNCDNGNNSNNGNNGNGNNGNNGDNRNNRNNGNGNNGYNDNNGYNGNNGNNGNGNNGNNGNGNNGNNGDNDNNGNNGNGNNGNNGNGNNGNNAGNGNNGNNGNGNNGNNGNGNNGNNGGNGNNGNSNNGNNDNGNNGNNVGNSNNGNNGNGNNGNNGNGNNGSNGNNDGNGNNGNNGDNGNGDNAYNGDNSNSDGRLRRWDLANVRRMHAERHHFSGRCMVKKAKRLSRILECAYRHKKIRKFKRHGGEKGLDVDITPEMVLPPMKYRQYYTYEGSLTTPPCNETVLWVVEKCHVQVSRRVLDALRNVEGYEDGTTLSKYGTRRPTQRNKHPLRVYKNFI